MHLLRRMKFANSMYRHVLRRSKKDKSQKALIESAPTNHCQESAGNSPQRRAGLSVRMTHRLISSFSEHKKPPQ